MRDFDYAQLNDDTKVLIVKLKDVDYLENPDWIDEEFKYMKDILKSKDIDVLFINESLELLHLSRDEMKELFKK